MVQPIANSDFVKNASIQLSAGSSDFAVFERVKTCHNVVYMSEAPVVML